MFTEFIWWANKNEDLRRSPGSVVFYSIVIRIEIEESLSLFQYIYFGVPVSVNYKFVNRMMQNVYRKLASLDFTIRANIILMRFIQTLM